MSINSTLAILYAQTNHAAKLAHESIVAPQVAAAMTRNLANEAIQQEQKKVPTVERGDQSKITADKDGRQRQRNFGSRRRKACEQPEEAIEEDFGKPADDNDILLGNLLNLKV